MQPRRIEHSLETAKAFIAGKDLEAPPAAVEPANEPAKKPNAMQEAVRLLAALEKIDAREHVALSNARARYDAERAALRDAASAAAKRILAAAEEE